MVTLGARRDHHLDHCDAGRCAHDPGGHREDRKLEDDPCDRAQAADTAANHVQLVIGEVLSEGSHVYESGMSPVEVVEPFLVGSDRPSFGGAVRVGQRVRMRGRFYRLARTIQRPKPPIPQRESVHGLECPRGAETRHRGELPKRDAEKARYGKADAGAPNCPNVTTEMSAL